jgi:predicted TIM-barrel fold metal-dependent hydrolase
MVIDADSHVMEPPDLWERYLEPRYRDRAIRIVVDGDGVEQLIMGEQVVLAGNLAGLGGAGVGPAELFGGGMQYRDGCPPASFDPAARLALYREWGLDAGVVFPTIGILPIDCTDDDLLSAYARAYNTWQAEFAAGTDGRALPIALLNLRDLDGAVRELDRCLALGFKGVFLPPEPVAGVRPGEPHFDPLWQRCAEAGAVVCLHVIVRFGGAGVPFEPWLMAGAGIVFGFTLGAPGQIIPALATMVLDGLFDRVPSMRVLCVEAGCGWAPYLMDRLDEKRGVFAEVLPPLALQPGDYLRRNVWFVAEPRERTIGSVCELVGEDRVLWGSDYPHIDSSLDAAELVRGSVAGLSEARRAAVLGGNAAALFGWSR